MRRFHVHLHVDDLARNIGFYSAMFDAAPTRTESDYAKWMLDDPPLNFAISTRGSARGIDHLGIQVDDDADLATLRDQARRADLALVDEGTTNCCYARSEKHWLSDPQGIAWEHFQTLEGIPMFSDAAEPAAEPSACCPPRGRPVGVAVSAAVVKTNCC
jgi:catechol 2,3-dioxygenase-like lactoylglutathione lyase family enzyme